MIRYDTIAEFNMDSKAECDQLNLAHVARKNIKNKKKEKIKQTNAHVHLVQYRLKIREGSPDSQFDGIICNNAYRLPNFVGLHNNVAEENQHRLEKRIIWPVFRIT